MKKKADGRGSWMKNMSKEQVSIIMRERANQKWSKIDKVHRSLIAYKLVESRRFKKNG